MSTQTLERQVVYQNGVCNGLTWGGELVQFVKVNGLQENNVVNSIHG